MDTAYDVVTIGGGVTGAMCACRIKEAKPQTRILLLDAGDNDIDDDQREAFVDAYQISPAKNVPSPVRRAAQQQPRYAPSSDSTGDPAAMNRSYVESGPGLFKSGFQRMVGGTRRCFVHCLAPESQASASGTWGRRCWWRVGAMLVRRPDPSPECDQAVVRNGPVTS
ncbi:hypothetical protein [Streptomyces coeruleorubidus]|uniref:hypothetical protein n=1 Tax=Streptomyces coeruleorubidus TaxID=116188 RepID=UPI003680147A